MFLRSTELIPLYGTEWLALTIVGLITVGFCWTFDLLVSGSRWRVERGLASRVGFAIVLALALFFGAFTWINALKSASPMLRPWLGALVILMLTAGVGSALGYFREELAGIGELGRYLTIAGAFTVLSLPFARGGEATMPPTHQSPPAGKTGANIVLITIDALAADHLSIYGYFRDTSPEMTKVSASSIIFDHFYSNSNFTSAGVGSILTGVLPWTDRILQLPARASDDLIRNSLPARLKAAGYTTAYFGSNPWAGGRVQGYANFFDYKNSEFDWQFGPCFDELAGYLPYLCSAASNLLVRYTYSALVHAAAALDLISLHPHSNPQAETERATRWAETVDKRSPIFLWVHYFPPHDPYAAAAPWLGTFDRSSLASTDVDSHPAVHFEAKYESAKRLEVLQARYDESIAFVDHSVGDLLSVVRKQFGPNTAIFLTADHGESFSHGYGSHGGPMLYDDLIHIPLIMSLPAALAGRRDDLASQIDLAPTIAAVAGIAPSPDWAGRSILTAPSDEPTVFSMNFEQNKDWQPLTTGAVACLQSHWKLVEFFGHIRYPHIPVLQPELFDLRADPSERQNLISAHPDVASTLSEEVRRQLSLHGGAEQ